MIPTHFDTLSGTATGSLPGWSLYTIVIRVVEFSRSHCTANMWSGITVEEHLKNCNFEKLQLFTVDLCSLYFLQVKNCKFNTIFM